MSSEKIEIEVAYALPQEQKIIRLKVARGTSVYDAVVQSGILDVFPEIDLENSDLGKFGKVVRNPGEEILADGDRVEIYRPLLIDPKQARLNRAAKKN